MTTDQELIHEIRHLNQQLKNQNSTKNIIGHNFFAGFFHSIGYFVGTVVLFTVFIYFASRFNLVNTLANSFEQFLSQIKWEKLVSPTPVINPKEP